MANSGSAFNLRGCQTTGGMATGAGAGQCGLSVTGPFNVGVDEPLVNLLKAKGVVTDEEVTALASQTSTQLLVNAIEATINQDFDLASAIRGEINNALARRGALETTRVAIDVVLSYECPKVGDALRWNHSTESYDRAYARVDTNSPPTQGDSDRGIAPYYDTEHLVEVVGIVESVSTTCEGAGSTGVIKDSHGIETNAVVVLSGLATFDLHPDNYLIPGRVYYLWDGTWHENVILGNNVTLLEPAISKPLFIATGSKSAFITNYRALTGSATGGKPLTEEYSVTVTVIPGGWHVKIVNVGNLSSNYPLVAELVYDRRDGSPQVRMHEVVGQLRTAALAAVDDDHESEYEFDATIDSIFGTEGGNTQYAPDGINGVGELQVLLKSNSRNFTLKTEFLGLAKIADSGLPVVSIPKLQITPTCADFEDANKPNFVWQSGGLHGDAPLTDGAMFEIVLLEGIGDTTVGQELGFKIAMAEEIGCVMSSPEVLTQDINAQFKLDNNQNAVEIFPATDSGSGITKRDVTFKIVTKDNQELPTNHWARYLTDTQIKCDSLTCCDPNNSIILIPNRGTSVNLSDILSADGLINNRAGAKFYTMDPSEASPIPYVTDDGLRISWRNMRENSQFCYPKSVLHGTEPTFMTIYSNEARTSTGTPTGEGARHYDPLYTLMEIGAQETLEGELVRLTLNAGNVDGREECCLEFEYHGTMAGTHYTIAELSSLGWLKSTSAGCS